MVNTGICSDEENPGFTFCVRLSTSLYPHLLSQTSKIEVGASETGGVTAGSGQQGQSLMVNEWVEVVD